MRTHRERAKRAWRKIIRLQHLPDEDRALEIIARATYPADLVQAATDASCLIQDAIEGNSMPALADLDRLRRVIIDLYDRPKEA